MSGNEEVATATVRQ